MISRRQLYSAGEPLGDACTRIEVKRLICGGGGSGGGSSTNTVQKADPWSGVQPGLNQLYGSAGNLFASDQPVYYPYQTQAYVNAPAPDYSQYAVQPTQQPLPSQMLQQQQFIPQQPTSPFGIAGLSGGRQTLAARMRQSEQNATSPLSSQQAAPMIQPGTQYVPGLAPPTGTNPLLNDPNANILGESPESRQAREMMTQRALAGSPLVDQAQQNLSNTLAGKDYWASQRILNEDTLLNRSGDLLRRTIGGEYLGANPYLDKMYASAARPITENWENVVNPGIASQFAAGGRYGSPAQAFALSQGAGRLGQTLGDLSANLYGQNYEQERNRQYGAVGQATNIAQMYQQAREQERQRMQAGLMIAPSLDQAGYAPSERLAGIGQNLEQRQQRFINADIARWDAAQNKQLNKLNAYSQLLQGGQAYGGSTSRSEAGPTGGGGFNAMGALGGAATAYGIGSAAGIGGLGAAGTAGLGAIGPVGWGILGLGALAGSGVFS